MALQALHIHAGPTARRHLERNGLRPEDVRAIPAAAGGPKGLVLSPLDRFIFGQWLPRSVQPVHLLGASIGAWRMATACLDDPSREFARMADDYIRQDYPHAPGKAPAARDVSRLFGDKLAECFGGREAQVLAHPRYRLHVFTSRGRHLLRRDGRLRTPLGYLGAFTTNAVSRRAMGGWLERVVFSDPREPLPIHLKDFRTQQVALSEANLRPSVLASCSIPFWLEAVRDIPGAPSGAYWDGGITDYHLHLDYASMPEGLVLYPHFQKTVIPGWLDKALRHRHRATQRLDNLVVLSPNPAWVAGLPNAKLPDRNDFRRFGDDLNARIVAWSAAVSASEQLAEEFARWLERPDPARVQPL
jgi:hypothetical protein